MRAISELEAFEMYDEMLDDCYPEYTIGYASFTASEILKTLDPIMYREGAMEYFNSINDMVLVDGYTVTEDSE